MADSVSGRVQKHREHLRQSGLRPMQIWVPDTKNPNFVRECHRQSKLAAQADMANAELLKFMDETLSDIDGWTA